MILKAKTPIYGGYTLGSKEKVIFIEGAIPDEVVEVDIIHKRKDYMIATLKNVIKSSPDRIKPICALFRKCGGCHYQHILYSRQLRIKEEIIIDSLRRIGKIKISLDNSLYHKAFYYRKKAQLKVSPMGNLGFYEPLSHKVVEIKECFLLEPELNNVIKRIKEIGPLKGIKEIHLFCGDIVIALIKGKNFDKNKIIEILKKAGISGVHTENKVLYGERKICLDLNGYFYFISCGSFFQTNWSLNKKLINLIINIVKNLNVKSVVDLYAGAGNFSIPLSEIVDEVIAVEENPISCEDGKDNCKINKIKNIRFINKKIEKFKIKKNIDLAIIDPPRIGLSKKALENIKNMSPTWIIYLSCNPSTFARDIHRLKYMYILKSVKMIDMFAQTYHIEVLGILRKNNNEKSFIYSK